MLPKLKLGQFHIETRVLFWLPEMPPSLKISVLLTSQSLSRHSVKARVNGTLQSVTEHSLKRIYLNKEEQHCSYDKQQLQDGYCLPVAILSHHYHTIAFIHVLDC